MSSQALMNTYSRLPVAFDHGEGVWLYDTEGKRYLDALSGIAVNGLGHAHPAVTKAIAEQSAKLIHCSNLYEIPQQTELADELTKVSGMSNVFFGNSGAEANEAAIKAARRFGHSKGIDTPAVIVMEHSFHGRTMATLSATANRHVQAGFEPLVSGFVRVPYNDVDAVRAVAEKNPNIVAILVEPVQGEGGIYVPADDYLNQLRDICDQYDWLLMLDEVQSGNARTGRYYAFQYNNIVPDVLSTAKGIANGLPMGACFTHGKAADLFGPGMHGTTYGGSPLVCSVGLAVTRTIQEQNLCEHAEQMGNYIMASFRKALAGVQGVVEVRGKGLMLAIELDRECTDLVKLALDAGLLINVTGAKRVVRLLPPLIINTEEADLIVDGVSKLLINYLGQTA